MALQSFSLRSGATKIGGHNILYVHLVPETQFCGTFLFVVSELLSSFLIFLKRDLTPKEHFVVPDDNKDQCCMKIPLYDSLDLRGS
jgi:hypothetical protein